MATLYITEFQNQGIDGNGARVPAPVVPSVAHQSVGIGASSQASAAFNAGTSLVRLIADVSCFVSFGANPTASSATMALVANVPEYFVIPAGSGLKVAAITRT